VGDAAAQTPDLGYSKNVSWHLDSVPELAPMQDTIQKVLQRGHVAFTSVDGKAIIEGFDPGTTYTPSALYIRDTATDVTMARYYYGPQALRGTLEELLRQQYPDGSVSATVGPDFKVDKATVVSDEETSAVMDAVEVYDMLPDPAWLNSQLRGQSIIDRLNRAMTWVLTARRDPATGLIKRAHTTDWGDIKWEPSPDPSHMQPGDQWTLSIYDQAIAYAALQGLARLNAAAGRDPDRAHWEGTAAELRSETDNILWQDAPSRGYYRIHVHVAPDTIRHDVPDDNIIAIGNAAAVYYGLASPDKVPRILDALARAQKQAGAPKPGLSLEPPYNGWADVQMSPRSYQNGALWDWWAGRQISGEFWTGYWRRAREHLQQVAQDWATHPGTVREWESPWLDRTGADQAYSGAAAVVGQSIVEGLFGVQMIGKEVHITPRLDDANGGVRVYEPATDTYVAYEYQASERGETIRYGTNSPTAASIRLPVRWRGQTLARLDGKDFLTVVYEHLGEELIGTVVVPSGQHRVEFFEVPSGRKKF
ncbi:MAG: hypothetical protein JOY61_03550, partial [Chloroflexi bacterium]|nr:hypothetical protein [Chloroflexota bacterium]